MKSSISLVLSAAALLVGADDPRCGHRYEDASHRCEKRDRYFYDEGTKGCSSHKTCSSLGFGPYLDINGETAPDAGGKICEDACVNGNGTDPRCKDKYDSKEMCNKWEYRFFYDSETEFCNFKQTCPDKGFKPTDQGRYTDGEECMNTCTRSCKSPPKNVGVKTECSNEGKPQVRYYGDNCEKEVKICPEDVEDIKPKDQGFSSKDNCNKKCIDSIDTFKNNRDISKVKKRICLYC